MEPDPSQQSGALDAREVPAEPHTQALLEFLATAPEPLRTWAEAQAREVRFSRPVPVSEPSSAGPAPEPADLALAELGEHDDEPRRQPVVHTPIDRPPSTVVPRRRPGAMVPVLGVLVILAVVYGVFRLGLPAESATSATQPPTQASAGDGAARMAELEAKLADNPDDVAANLELGVLSFNAGDVERAERLWTVVTTVDPRNPQAWFNLGFVHLSKDPPDVEAARVYWQEVLDVAPDSDLAATVRSHLTAMSAPSPTPTQG